VRPAKRVKNPHKDKQKVCISRAFSCKFALSFRKSRDAGRLSVTFNPKVRPEGCIRLHQRLKSGNSEEEMWRIALF